MAVIKCKECGGQVATSAKACPHCGGKVPKRVGLLGWLFVIFIVFPAAWGLGIGMNTASNNSVSEKNKESNIASAKPASKWMRNEFRDAMTDKPKIVLSIRSLNSTIFEFPYQQVGGSHLTLNFRRQGSELDAYLLIDKGQMLCGIRDCSFNLRVGDGDVQPWVGLKSSTSDSNIMFVRDAKELESIVKQGGKIRIGIDFYKSGTRAFEFDVGQYPEF